ncbi:hypothetical protein [Geodermatophilus sabuli]|uniref:Uncharacterized protein n=1 Tax=Geodermatophilus sabuli TaxID=1564158 RepID=A0A285EBZ5_9ACTN|nr:hypothetical protein [Geodermatophilus sabuli]MBB3084074.1 hypothetical protein [Geodermatophilus sabuli]SNX96652.1 hypothetical protein SAMN06893097_104367 [Geodermatophilus sabuli]
MTVPAPTGAGVALVLHVGAGPHHVGVPVPVAVRITNTGAAPIRMPCVLDGSETATRLPHYGPAVLYEGAQVAAPPAAEDPLVGPVRPEDLRLLRPGEWFDPTARSDGGGLPLSTFSTFRPDRPGAYRFTLRLDTTGGTEAWMGRFGQEPYREPVLPLIAEVPQVALTAAVDVVVEP